MKYLKKLSIFIPILISLSCSGCGYLGSKLPKNKLTQREQICSNLKQKMTFGKTDQSFTIDRANANQLAHYTKTYHRYNCSDFEKK